MEGWSLHEMLSVRPDPYCKIIYIYIYIYIYFDESKCVTPSIKNKIQRKFCFIFLSNSPFLLKTLSKHTHIMST